MAVFDSEQNKVIARIAYDGTVMAGKTTNLRQLCSFFTTMRRSELFTPGEVNDRTLFFDWLQLDGGLVCGYGLRCQLVTVPGQLVLARRRAHIISTADVLVFVCDSTPDGVKEAQSRFEKLCKYIGHASPKLSLVVQANKQDLPEALTLAEIAAQLNIEPYVPIIPAQACEGIGVRETVVVAVRAAANRIQKAIIENGIQSLHGTAESGQGLLDTLLSIEQSMPRWTIDTLLEQDLLNEAEVTEAASPPQQETDELTDEENPLASFVVDDLTKQESSPEEVGQKESDPLDLSEEAEETSEEIVENEPALFSGIPPLPCPNVLMGFIWPAATGREIVRRLPVEDVTLRRDLVAQPGARNGSGTPDAIICRAGDWCLKTSGRRRFKDVDEGRASLLSLARAKMMLGRFLLRDTVLILQPDEAENYWLWTVAPWVETLQSRMSEADAKRDEKALGAALATFAKTAVDAMRLAARFSTTMDVHPGNFGVLDGEVLYIDDDIGKGRLIPTIGYALLHRVDEYAHWSGAIDVYLETLETEISHRLSREDAQSLDLARIIDETIVRSSEAQVARRELTAMIMRRPAKGD